MERFTKRDKYGYAHIKGDIYEGRDYNGISVYVKAIDKLTKLEDLEEELGIDLHILFMALKNGIYVIESNDGYIVEDCICSIEHFKDGWGIVTNNEELELMMSDYGKIWALTREELEK